MAAVEAEPLDLAPLGILADLFAERGDPREAKARKLYRLRIKANGLRGDRKREKRHARLTHGFKGEFNG